MIEQSEIRVKEAFFAILGHRRSFAVFKRSSGGSKVVSLSGLPHWRGRIFHRSGHFFTFIYLSFLHKKQGSRTRRSASKFWIDPKPCYRAASNYDLRLLFSSGSKVRGKVGEPLKWPFSDENNGRTLFFFSNYGQQFKLILAYPNEGF